MKNGLSCIENRWVDEMEQMNISRSVVEMDNQKDNTITKIPEVTMTWKYHSGPQ